MAALATAARPQEVANHNSVGSHASYHFYESLPREFPDRYGTVGGRVRRDTGQHQHQQQTSIASSAGADSYDDELSRSTDSPTSSGWGGRCEAMLYGTGRFQPRSASTNPMGYYTVDRSAYSRCLAVSAGGQNGPALLKVSLPPESGAVLMYEHVMADEPAETLPHLEASPRRYRFQPVFQQEQQQQQHYGHPPTNMQTFRPLQASAPAASDEPPKLPERTHKSASASPPPLPPKRPNTQLTTVLPTMTWRNGTLATTTASAMSSTDALNRDDIYDFPPDPVIGSTALTQEESRKCISDILALTEQYETQQLQQQSSPQLVTMEELSRMSVMELNERMEAGQLPAELRGMTIFELVEHIANQMRTGKHKESSLRESPPLQQLASAMKNSFSDNFVGSASSAVSTASLTRLPSAQYRRVVIEEQMSQCSSSMSPGPPSSIGNRDSQFSFSGVASPALSCSSEQQANAAPSHNAHLAPLNGGIAYQPIPSETTSLDLGSQPATMQTSGGFEDDFGRMNVNAESPTKAISEVAENMRSADNSLTTTSAAEDRYAVFRELQLEEELLRAWKTPSDEEKEKVDEAITNEEEEEKEREASCSPVKANGDGASSEESASSESDESNASEGENNNEEGDVEDEGEDEVAAEEEHKETEEAAAETLYETASHCSSDLLVHNVGQNGDVDDHAVGQPDTAFEKTFGSAEVSTGLAARNVGGWATFDEEESNDGSQQHLPRPAPTSASHPARSPPPPCHAQPLSVYRGRPLSAKSVSDWDAAARNSHSNPDSAVGSPRVSVSSGQRSLSSAGRELYWSAAAGRPRPVGRRSSGSDDHNNPFGQDSFGQDADRRTLTETPPVFEGEMVTGRYSCLSSEDASSLDVFREDSPGCYIDEDGFRVQAKVPKSDSVNIFCVRDDPFDDDFFK
jgi:hypothetical protein